MMNGELDVQLLVGNRTSGRVEVYRVSCLHRTLTSRDIVWTSPPVEDATEVKPVVFGGERAILVASKNGVIIFSYESKEVLFHREVHRYGMNIHSAEPLPDGNVAVVDAEGWLGILYPAGKDEAQASSETRWYELPCARGVYWDSKRQSLYALGYLELAVYKYHPGGRDGRLLKATTYSIKSYYDRYRLYGIDNEDAESQDGGHDLYPVGDSADMLFLTTGEHVFTCDIKDHPGSFAGRGAARLTPYEPLYAVGSRLSDQVDAADVVRKKGGVKAISKDPRSGLVLAHAAPFFTRGLSYPYSGSTLLLAGEGGNLPDLDLSDEQKLRFEDATFYKVRVLSWRSPPA